jgi:hypothetical protein
MLFSPSPTYFEVSVAAEMLKNVAAHSFATARASNVFPFPIQKINLNTF